MMTEQETRILKSVALKAAVEMDKIRTEPVSIGVSVEKVIAVAKEFEKYLRGESAEGPRGEA